MRQSQSPTEDENEVWGYITKCRQLLTWQLSEDENADLREIVFPALAKSKRNYETLGGRLRDEEYADQLRQVMHLYHTVVMDVCDWMIYNKEYFHLLIGNYTTFDEFANAVDSAIMDECRGTQSRVWTRKGIVDLEEPIQVGTPHSSHAESEDDFPAITESSTEPPTAIPTHLHAHSGVHAPRATPTTAAVPVTPPAPKHVLTPALAVLSHLPPSATHAHAAHKPHVIKPRALHTPPHTPPEETPAKPVERFHTPDPDSVLFKVDPVPAPAPVASPKPVGHHATHDEYHDHELAMQAIDILDDEAYKPNVGIVTPAPQLRRASLLGSPRPLVPPLSRRPTMISAITEDHEPAALAAPAPRRPTIVHSLHPGPSSPRRGSTWELGIVDNYSPSHTDAEEASPVEYQGPTFPISTPFYTKSRPPTPQPEPATPPPPLGPTFELPTPFYVKPRRDTIVAPPADGPSSPVELVGPTFDIPTPFFVKPRRPTIVAPEELGSPTIPDGPTFPLNTPLFTYAKSPKQRALSPEPREPPLGPTFEVRTPLFVYSKRVSALPDPEPASPDEPSGPTFPVATPLFTYSARTLPAHLRNSPPTYPLWNPPFNPHYAPVNVPPVCVSPPPQERPVTITVPNLKIIAPSLASSKLDTFPSANSESFPVSVDMSPKSESFPESVSSNNDAVIATPAPHAEELKEEVEDFRLPASAPAEAPLQCSDESIKSVDCGSSGADAKAPEPEPEPVASSSRVYSQSPEHPDESLDKFPQYDSSSSLATPHSATVALPWEADSLSGPGAGVPGHGPRRNDSSTTISSINASPKRGKPLSLAKRAFWEQRESEPPAHAAVSGAGHAHAASPSTSSAPAHSSSHVVPQPSPPPRIRPMSSNGSLQHQWTECESRSRSECGDCELGLEFEPLLTLDTETETECPARENLTISDVEDDDDDEDDDEKDDHEDEDAAGDEEYPLRSPPESESESTTQMQIQSQQIQITLPAPAPTTDVPYTPPAPIIPTSAPFHGYTYTYTDTETAPPATTALAEIEYTLDTDMEVFAMPPAPRSPSPGIYTANAYPANDEDDDMHDVPETRPLTARPLHDLHDDEYHDYSDDSAVTGPIHDSVHGVHDDQGQQQQDSTGSELPLPVTTPTTVTRSLPNIMPGALSASPLEVWKTQKGGAISFVIFFVLWICMLYF